MLRSGTFGLGKSKRYHLVAGTEALCGAKPNKRNPYLPGQPVLGKQYCKQCEMVMDRVVAHIANAHGSRLFVLGDDVAVTSGEIDAALAVPNIRKPEPEYTKLELPAEFLPTGSGQLIKRGW